MEIKKAYLVFNSGAGKNRSNLIAEEIASVLKNKCNADCSLFESNSAESDRIFAKSVIEEEKSVVIVLGGDGTLGAIVRSLVEQNKNIPLAIFPCGTANDFATACCIPKKVPEFVEFLTKSEPISIDIAKVCENSYAINAVGSGNFSNGVTIYSHKAKKIFGKFGYYFKCVGEFFKIKFCKLTFKCDDEEPFCVDTYMYYLVNSHRAGGFNHFAPTAEINDGKFDLIIIKKCNLFQCLSVFSSILRGKTLKNKHIIAKNVQKLIVTGGEGHDKFYRCDIDGNAGPIGTLNVEILKGKVKIFTNCNTN